jgi:hypothetical protein
MYGHSSQLAAFTTVTGTGFFFTGAHIAAIAIMAVTLGYSASATDVLREES